MRQKDLSLSALEIRSGNSIAAPGTLLSRYLLPMGSGMLLLIAAVAGHGSVPDTTHTQTAPVMPAAAQSFLGKNCVVCHSKKSASGGLDLTSTAFRPNDTANFNLWVKVYDRVSAGEMPPKSFTQPAPAARKNFLAALGQPLVAVDESHIRREGRSTWRRMNRYEYENTLRDLLGAPWLQIKEMLPEDGLTNRLNKVGDTLDVSHVQMSRYLSAADYALHQAMAPQPNRPETTTRRYYAREQGSFVGPAKFTEFNGAAERATFPILGDAADIPALKETAPMTVGAADPVKREHGGDGRRRERLRAAATPFRQVPRAGRRSL